MGRTEILETGEDRDTGDWGGQRYWVPGRTETGDHGRTETLGTGEDRDTGD